MSPNTTPTDPADTEADEPRSAAEHCAAATTLFAQARAMYPNLSSRGHDQDEYQRCLDWARMHLRLAEAITAGAELVLTHRHLLANRDVRQHDSYVGGEAQLWDDFFEVQHKPVTRSA